MTLTSGMETGMETAPTAKPKHRTAPADISPVSANDSLLLRRAAAQIIDVLLVFMAAVVVALLVHLVFSTSMPCRLCPTSYTSCLNSSCPSSLTPLQWVLNRVTPLALVGAFAYFTLLERRFGVTLGKALLAIKVTDAASAGSISFGQSAIRTAARLVDCLPLYCVGLWMASRSTTGQRLGDQLAGTVVVINDSA